MHSYSWMLLNYTQADDPVSPCTLWPRPLVLGFLGLSLYLYQIFPEILKQQARHALQEIGVDDIDGLTGTLDTTAVLNGGHIQLTIEPFQLSGNLSTGNLALTEDTLHWLRWKGTVPVLWNGKEALKMTYSDGNWSGQLHSTLLEL